MSMERRLRRVAASTGTPLDENVVELAVALNLLGFPTIGSCGGHSWQPGDDELMLPFVAIRQPMTSRFEGERGRRLWNDLRAADARERRYMALLAWRRYRPLRDRLEQLYHSFISEQPATRGGFAARATWRGVVFEPRDLEQFWDETDPAVVNQALVSLQAELEAFGRHLRRLAATSESPAAA